ncbi:MAG: hypothetical protein V1872_01100 [bacterium]
MRSSAWGKCLGKGNGVDNFGKGTRSWGRGIGVLLSCLVLGQVVLLVVGMVAGTAAAAVEGPKWQGGFPKQDGEKILLLWSPVPKASAYRIYRDDKLLTTVQNNNYIDEKITPDQQYSYAVKAIVDNSETPSSEKKIVKVPKKVELKIITVTQPSGVDALALSDQIALLWDMSSSPNVAGYNIYRSTNADSGFEKIGTSTNNSYSDRNVSPGKTYYYAVKALDKSFKETEMSKIVSGKINIVTTLSQNKKEEPKLVVKSTNLLKRIKLPGYALEVAVNNKGEIYASCLASVVKYSSVVLNKDDKEWDDKKDAAEEEIKVIDGDGKYMAGMTFNNKGELIVSDFLKNEIKIFSGDHLIYSFSLPNELEGTGYTSQGRFLKYKKSGPYDISQSSVSKKFYIVDGANTRVLVFDQNYKYIGVLGQGTENMIIPGAKYIGINSEGMIYISAFNMVYLFDKEEKFIKKFGGEGQGVGNFKAISGLALDNKDRLYLDDASNATIQVFDKEGKFLYVLSNNIGDGPIKANLPIGCYITDNQLLYVIEQASKRMAIFKINK